ncbi:MAG: dTDP-4-dehydrorhamnose 3,5-epimerase family protein [Patescibacteria group bacterium]
MIEGVIIKEAKKYEDARGWVAEFYRSDEINFIPQMAYVSFSKFNIVRGPHEHTHQSDYFCFFGPGNFEMYLWDDRKDSVTYGEHFTMIVGEDKPTIVIVPPGVVHGYKCVSENGAWYINQPDGLYAGKDKKEPVDEIRHEAEENSRFKIE